MRRGSVTGLCLLPNRDQRERSMRTDFTDYALYRTATVRESGFLPNRDRQGAGVLPNRDRQGAGVLPNRDRQGAGFLPNRDRQGVGLNRSRLLTRHPSGHLRVDVLQCHPSGSPRVDVLRCTTPLASPSVLPATATPAGVFDRMFPGCTTSCRLRTCCWRAVQNGAVQNAVREPV
jgi:hypothetical protein